jgi:hypothetical protein
MSMDKL